MPCPMGRGAGQAGTPKSLLWWKPGCEAPCRVLIQMNGECFLLPLPGRRAGEGPAALRGHGWQVAGFTRAQHIQEEQSQKGNNYAVIFFYCVAGHVRTQSA